MHVTITVKAQAESKGELIDTFAAQVNNLRQHFDSLKQEGIFGPPDQCDLRYLVIGGGFREPIEAERTTGIPNVE
jgi:hypothetical protein